MTRGQADNRRAVSGASQAHLQVGLLTCVWGLLAGVAAWRVVLAARIFQSTSLPGTMGAGIVHWRRLDDFGAWMAVAVLLLGREGGVVAENLRQARMGKILTVFLAVGMVLTGTALAFEQLDWAPSTTGGIALGGWLVLGLLALVLTLGEVRAIWTKQRVTLSATKAVAGPARGVTILDLWRFAAAQWGLSLAAAVIFVAATHAEDRLGTESVRNMLFLVPAAGVLPNALMAAGIGWWDQLLRADGAVMPAPRLRAWVVALVLLNAGAMMLVLPGGRLAWLGIPGAVLEMAAMGLYVMGFPGGAWRSVGGKAVLAAWGLLAVALGALAIERIFLLGSQPLAAVRLFSTAWRYVWIEGAVPLWLLAMATLAMERLPLLAGAVQAMRVMLAAMGLVLAGAVITAGVYLLASTRTGEAQLPVMQWVIAGPLAAAVGMLLGGWALWRVAKVIGNW